MEDTVVTADRHSHQREISATAGSDEVLLEVILQLPLGLVCADLEGKVLFMNTAAKDLLQFQWAEHGRARHQEFLNTLPYEVRTGIEYFTNLLTREHISYPKPFPKLSLRNHAGCDMELVVYCQADELSRETYHEARLIVLLQGKTPLVPTGALARHFSLTRREKEVLNYLMTGKARKEIAAEMQLSEETVRSYFRNLYQKLGVTNRVEAATLGLRLELVESLKSALEVHD